MLVSPKIKIYPNRQTFLVKEVRTKSRIAELGVHAGKFSKIIHALVDPQELWLIDYFGIAGQVMGPRWTGTLGHMEVLQKYFSENKNVRIIASDTRAWLQSRSADTLEAVYIDSLHTERQTSREIELSKQVVVNGGLIMGHDLNLPGVYKAVAASGLQLSALAFDTYVSYVLVNEK